MYRELKTIVRDIESASPQITQEKWNYILPKNQEYVKEHDLNKQLKFGRTIYIPYNKLIIISGSNVDLP